MQSCPRRWSLTRGCREEPAPAPEVSAAAVGRWLPGCDLVTGPHRDSLHLGAINAGWSAPWAPGIPVGFCVSLGAGEADTPARNYLWGSGQLPLLELRPLRGSVPPAAQPPLSRGQTLGHAGPALRPGVSPGLSWPPRERQRPPPSQLKCCQFCSMPLYCLLCPSQWCWAACPGSGHTSV